MISGFEKHTAPLTKDEQKLVRPMIEGLRTKLGAEKAITNKAIVEAMRKAGYKIDEPRTRKIINHIRVNDLLPRLIASSSGYYIATQLTDLQRYAKSLEERAKAIEAVKHSVDKDIAHMKEELNSRLKTMNMFAE